MDTAIVVLGILIAAAALFLAARSALFAYLRYRDGGVVQCPENRQAAGVRFDLGHAAVSAAAGSSGLRLSTCSRWPERQDCGQQCLQQIAAAPQDCLVRGIVAGWYHGKDCVYCGKPIPAIASVEHEPALLSPDNQMVQWVDIAPEKLDEVLACHRPVCWNCYVVTRVMRERPELIVQRSRPAKA